MKNYQKLLLAVLTLFVWMPSCKKKDVSKKNTVLYETDFSSDDGYWWTGTDVYGTTFISNGYYNMVTPPTGNGQNNTLTQGVFTGGQKNTAVEISLKVARNQTTDSYGAGLVWGKSGSGATRTAYYFYISPRGGYTVYGFPNGLNNPGVTYADWTTNSIVRPDGFNKLGIELKQGQYHFSINGREVYSMAAGNNAKLDLMGLGAGKGLNVQVDYFKASELP
ncbi:hypothetical protein [Niabella drilacis]|uniref:3-keto-disaccharide hydrolase domain-containing protein n=1 Tax=Niabella drilacis (strain DSM 25811 / CCM 8410 / CCUG 62505 / LMG 26954 / E90) TaxID=1285928 RepID=A0A1G6Z7F7_NIADE|nr:hypothetical protein [Niabella drilacis]SDD97907.1 hypothetical protein SAMN04487894_11765 [Niabella drilacis]